MRFSRLSALLFSAVLLMPAVGLSQTLTTGTGPPTTATKIIEVPGTTYKLRLYAKGQNGWYLTSNASTDRAELWIKDDPAINSQVLWLGLGAELRLAFDNDPSATWWSTGQRWVRWIGSVPQWRVGTNRNFPIHACSHTGMVKSARAGDVLYFSVPFPVAFDTTPSSFVWNTDDSAAVDVRSLSIKRTDDYHAEATINVQADGDAYWVGCLTVG